ncbi:globin domain-containing protein [Spirosoma endbachense]|nr:globin domain-containing protein [Spirosoma endbachense]
MRTKMTPQQFIVVKQSWRLLRAINPALLGEVFYGQLFMRYPALRPFFPGPMESQYQKLVDMLSLIIARLDRETVTEEIAQLAQRHKGYGVKSEHFDAVGQSLLWTLEQGLGRDWNDTVRTAWEACYTDLRNAMLEKM